LKKKKQVIISKSSTQTASLAHKLHEIVKKKKVVFLTGPLGSGKSTFVQALGRALGIVVPITSPTFTLIKEYQIPKSNIKFVHIDLYRIMNHPESIYELRIEQYFGQDIVCIEWAESLLNTFPLDSIHLDFRYDEGEQRTITIITTNKTL
jgi:tRNA threonylcarbamoyladenosine biosynthesis protein TsaE